VYQSGLFQKYIDRPPSETDVADEADPAWLGIFTQPLTDDLAEYWGLRKEGGIVVSSIVAGSPAETAGFERGDVIVDFNGTPIKAQLNRDVIGFTKLVRDTGVGEEVTVKALRDGEPVEITVTLGERPKSSQEAGEFVDTTFGLTVREITTDLRIVLNLPDDVQGVIVRRVKSGSWAQLAGMRTGVIIMGFGDHPTRNLEEFEQALADVIEAEPGEVPVFCRAGAQTGFFRIQPRWENDAQE
jgi:serine protease Do